MSCVATTCKKMLKPNFFLVPVLVAEKGLPVKSSLESACLPDGVNGGFYTTCLCNLKRATSEWDPSCIVSKACRV